MKEIAILKRMKACGPAIKWLEKQSSYQQAWRDCPRGDWMLWDIYKTLDGSESAHRKFTIAKVCCAKTVFHLMKDERSRNAVLVAEKYGLGEATLVELKKSAATAAAAYADLAAAAADAAAAAAYAAAYAAARKENQMKTANIVRELYPDPPMLA